MASLKNLLSTDDDCDSLSVVLTTTPCASTNDLLNSGVMDSVVNQNIDLDLFEIAERLYRTGGQSVTAILDKVFASKFLEDPDWRRCQYAYDGDSPEKGKEKGILIHDYINKFYKNYYNDPDPEIIAISDNFVRAMLDELKKKPNEPIAYDNVIQPNDHKAMRRIHIDLHPELVQFYNWAIVEKMIVYKSDFNIEDPIRRVTGRCNALFRMKEYNYDDEHLMLYDWSRSVLMLPGNWTLMKKRVQMNYYKNILEKYYEKKILGSKSVILHKDIETYEIIQIEDIDFHI